MTIDPQFAFAVPRTFRPGLAGYLARIVARAVIAGRRDGARPEGAALVALSFG